MRPQQRRYGDGLIEVRAAVSPIAGGNANEQRTLPARSYRIHDLQREAQAVLQRTAVAVAAAIRKRRHEAGDEISVCKVELQRIEPAARRRPTRRGKDADGVRDVARGHLFGKRRVRRIRDRRCRHESPPALSERPVDTLRARSHRSSAARVAELEGDAAPCLVHAFHRRPQQVLPCSIDDRRLGRDPAILSHADELGDHQAGPLGSGSGEVRPGRQDGPVGHGQVPDSQRREHRWRAEAHGTVR